MSPLMSPPINALSPPYGGTNSPPPMCKWPRENPDPIVKRCLRLIWGKLRKIANFNLELAPEIKPLYQIWAKSVKK